MKFFKEKRLILNMLNKIFMKNIGKVFGLKDYVLTGEEVSD